MTMKMIIFPKMIFHCRLFVNYEQVNLPEKYILVLFGPDYYDLILDIYLGLKHLPCDEAFFVFYIFKNVTVAQSVFLKVYFLTRNHKYVCTCIFEISHC